MSILTTKKVQVSVPGTTANLGPAFDVTGMALSCSINVQVHAADKFELNLTGLGSDNADVLNPQTNMVVLGCSQMFDELGVPADKRPALKWTIHSDVPTKAGCGSSSAAVVAGMVAALGLTGTTTLDLSELLRLADKIEGHPDNAAPAIFGGMQLVIRTTAAQEASGTGQLRVMTIPVPEALRVVVFTPFKVMKASTTANRQIVPTQVSMGDAIYNIGRTAVLLAGLMTNDKDGMLKFCGGEKFHQEQRAAALYPHFTRCMAAAEANGARHAFLSGAGPSCAAFVFGGADVEETAKKIGVEMEKAAMLGGENAVEGVSRVFTVQHKPVEVIVSDL